MHFNKKRKKIPETTELHGYKKYYLKIPDLQLVHSKKISSKLYEKIVSLFHGYLMTHL
jgi:hypothetical protein